MEKKPTRQSVFIAFIILASLPFLSRYSSKAGYFVENYFSNFAYKIGDSGEPTGVFLSIFCEVLALLISTAIIVAVIIFPIWRGIKKIKKGLVHPLSLSFVLMYYFYVLVLGFFVNFSFFTIDTLKKMTR